MAEGGGPGEARLWYASLERTVRVLKGRTGRGGDPRGMSWDAAKASTNPFELVHSAPPCVWAGPGGARKHPVGRGFFKLWELLHGEAATWADRPLTFAYMGEAPGSFAEAAVTMRRERRPEAAASDAHFGISLARPGGGDSAVPAWKTSPAWCAASGLVICWGADGTGCLYSRRNVDRFVEECGGGGSADVVTADGGFDFSPDFDRQEEDMLPLLRAEMGAALLLLAEGGTAVIKVFDAYRDETLAMMEAFASCFSSWSLRKPVTSRPANSERYLVCRGFGEGGAPGRGARLAAAGELLSGAGAGAGARAGAWLRPNPGAGSGAGGEGAQGQPGAALRASGAFDRDNLSHALRQAEAIARALEASEGCGEDGGVYRSPHRRARAQGRPQQGGWAEGGGPAGEGLQERAARWWWARYGLPGASVGELGGDGELELP